MKVIGLIGLIGSGKDLISDYLSSKYGYSVITMGDIVREIATKLGRTHERYDLQLTQKEMTEKYGMEYFPQQVVKKIREGNVEKVVINGIRRPEDAIIPKREFGKDMLIIYVDVDPKIRFERMKLRKREGDPETFEDFKKQEENEFKFFRLEETINLADVTIDNNSTKEHVYEQIDKILKQRGFE